jgi:hypothetical protein
MQNANPHSQTREDGKPWGSINVKDSQWESLTEEMNKSLL